MLIHSPQQLNTSDRSLSVVLNGNMLAQVKQAKVLGLTLDKFLIWTKHIDNLCITINSRLALLRRIKPFLTKDCALRIYNSCINSKSYLLLCNLIEKTAQKHPAHITLDTDFSTPSVLLSQIQIIPIFDLVKFRKLLLLINILTNPSARCGPHVTFLKMKASTLPPPLVSYINDLLSINVNLLQASCISFARRILDPTNAKASLKLPAFIPKYSVCPIKLYE